MNLEYYEGASTRAHKEQLPYTYSPDMLAGYNDMQAIVSPIENTIVMAALERSAKASKRLEEIRAEIERNKAVDPGQDQQAALPGKDDQLEKVP